MENSASVNYIKASFSHHFKFNYSEIKDLKPGQFVSTPVFLALDNEWVIDCYQRGGCRENQYHLSTCFLVRLYGEYDTVNPKISLSFMKKDRTTHPFSILYLKGDGTNYLEHAIKMCPLRWQVCAFGQHTNSLLWEQFGKDGSFDLICSIGNRDTPHNRCSLGVRKSFALPSQIGKLLDSTEKADVTVLVENRSFMCHRLILAARSPVLNAELFGNMAEASEKYIKIEDMSPEVFEALLHFIYTDAFPNCDSEESAKMAHHLFVAADRYAIEGLKTLCEDKLCGHISLDSVMTTLVLAQQHNSPRLKNACLEFIAKPGTVTSLILRDEYKDLVRNFPSIVAEIVSSFKNVKKQKT